MPTTAEAVSADLRELETRLREVHALEKVAELLEWDLQVNMPPGGGQGRAEQFSVVKRLAHERFTQDGVGRLLDRLSGACGGYDSDEASLVRVARRDYERKRRLPAALVGELAAQTARAQQVWVEARAKSDFAMFLPELEKMVALKRRQAEALGPRSDPYDAWLEEFEPGMETADVDRLFAELKPGLTALVRSVLDKAGASPPDALAGSYDIAKQRLFCEEAARAIGLDFERGRQDVSAHPFCLSFSTGDVRITTRFSAGRPFDAVFSTLHEAGHGIYEQNVAAELSGTPLCAGATMAVHESQSRLWENIVGRSRGFWKFLYPRFRELFPQAAGLGVEGFYCAVNRVEASLIRVDADELTYGLHVLMRYELERELLSGKLKPAELPAAWSAKMRGYLGVTPPDDRRGVLQDVHWSAAYFGYFPTYLVGNAIAAQLYAAALKKRPEIPAAVERGDFAPLRGWLVENVYRHGRKFVASELVERAAGDPISAGPYLRYLREKYGELYRLQGPPAPA